MPEQDGTEAARLTSGPLLARNTLWNLTGLSVPLVAAVLVIPLLTRTLGTDKFGVLTLIWAMIGYYNMFDLGIGRALTKLVAQKLGSRERAGIPQLTASAMALLVIFGTCGAAVLYVISPWLVGILGVPGALQGEVVSAFRLSAMAVPMIVISAGLAGFLAAMQRFDLINLVRMPMGLFVFVGPALVLPFSQSLVAITAMIIGGRLVALFFQGLFCLRVFPDLLTRYRMPSLKAVKQLVGFGSWMTISNIVSPVMVSMDRFIVGAVISVTAVAYYATSQEVVLKMSIIPAAIAATLFPALSTAMSSDFSRMVRLYHRSINSLIVIMFPVCLVLIAWSSQILDVWLGDDFSQNGGAVLQWLALGIFINSIAHLPFVMLQSAGRPDITAGIHLLELPLFLALIYVMCSLYGINGAAISWVIRASIDLILLMWFLRRTLRLKSPMPRRTLAMTAASLALFLLGALPAAPVAKGIFTVLALSLFFAASWRFLLTGDDKRYVTRQLRTLPLLNRA